MVPASCGLELLRMMRHSSGSQRATALPNSNTLHLHQKLGILPVAMGTSAAETVLELLRSRGLRMTPQRRAIVAEIMATDGHISPAAVARRVRDRVPGVNASTVYRTLDLLEELGILSHAHLESGAEYHRREDSEHVHLSCSRCGAQESLSVSETRQLKRLIGRHQGFQADFTHFAISGLCAVCQREAVRLGSRGGSRRRPARRPAPARARRSVDRAATGAVARAGR